jgi:hypothetical protein
VTPLELADLAALAYDHEPTLEAAGVEVLEVVVEDIAVVYAFRGTTFDGVDIFKDLRAWPRRDPELGIVHRGFGDGVRAIWPVLRARISVASADGRVVYFAGHSKGGAEAAIAAGLALVDGLPVRALVTFGAPRPGFAALATRLEGGLAIRRYVRGRDGIPRHGSAAWGYRHPGEAIRLGAKRGIWPRGYFTDHKIAGYVGALGRLTRSGQAGGPL